MARPRQALTLRSKGQRPGLGPAWSACQHDCLGFTIIYQVTHVSSVLILLDV